MKKILSVLLIMLSACVLFACGEDNAQTEGSSAPQQQTAPTASQGTTKNSTGTKVDVDLTTMNATMVYSTVYDLLNKSDNYVGKVVKVKGEFRVYYSSETNTYYPAVLIADAAACCSQGMEFLLKGNPKYPDSYPEIGQTITIKGTLENYYEGSDKYVRLAGSELV